MRANATTERMEECRVISRVYVVFVRTERTRVVTRVRAIGWEIDIYATTRDEDVRSVLAERRRTI